jgi:hypothetical protein
MCTALQGDQILEIRRDGLTVVAVRGQPSPLQNGGETRGNPPDRPVIWDKTHYQLRRVGKCFESCFELSIMFLVALSESTWRNDFRND